MIFVALPRIMQRYLREDCGIDKRDAVRQRAFAVAMKKKLESETRGYPAIPSWKKFMRF